MTLEKREIKHSTIARQDYIAETLDGDQQAAAEAGEEGHGWRLCKNAIEKKGKKECQAMDSNARDLDLGNFA